MAGLQKDMLNYQIMTSKASSKIDDEISRDIPERFETARFTTFAPGNGFCIL